MRRDRLFESMTRCLHPTPDPEFRPRGLPGWVRRGPCETAEDAGVRAGAALALLGVAMAHPSLPQALWRGRLALAAAAHTAALSGRRTPDGALRDILCLLQPGEQPGPAGEIAFAWQRATARPLSDASLQRAVPRLAALQHELWRKGSGAQPVARAAHAIEALLTEAPREIAPALILADAALARAMGWSHLVPLLGASLSRRDLMQRGADLRLACHMALIRAVDAALPLSADLTQCAARLQAILPKLRSKQASAAVGVILTRDAIAPAALRGLMSDRAARRFCDRLVALGALREVTGRDTFRLYGL